MKLETQDSRSKTNDDTGARLALVEAGRWLIARGLVLGTAGNLSTRLTDGSVLLTPSAVAYAAMQPEDIVRVSSSGKIEQAALGRRPTSEMALHLTCLERYPEIGAVVHSHARSASAFALAHRAISCDLEEMLAYLGGDIPVGDYRLTGTQELADEAARHLAQRSAVVLANHGLLVIGRNLEQALQLTSLAERCAEIALRARQLGDAAPLPEEARATLTTWYRQQRYGT